MKQSIILAAFVGVISASRLTYEGYQYPWGSPYSYAEEQATNREVREAWEMIEFKKNVADLEEKRSAAKRNSLIEDQKKIDEWNYDIIFPSHIQGRKYEIADEWNNWRT